MWNKLLGQKKRLITLALILMLGGGGWYIWYQNQNSLVVANESGEVVNALTVIVGQEHFAIDNIAAGTEITVPFGKHTEEKFELNGRLPDGTRFSGHFARGPEGEQVKLAIGKGGKLELRQAKK